MNLRKFYFNLTLVVAIVLFISGAGILYYANAHMTFSEIISQNPDDDSITDIFRPLVQNKEPFNVLLIGGDKVNMNADVMMLANFNPETMKINIMSIPRDTKVIIKNKEHKINYAYPSGGVELAAKTVSELLDVNIKYYVFVDTEAFRKIIDLLGGVDYYIPVDLDYDDPTQNLHIHLKKGQQTLNGAQAEQFIRFRKPNKWTKELRQYYDGSDIKRTEAQQNFIRELMRQKLNIQYLPKLTSIINTLFENIETNFTLNEVVKMTGFISKFRIDNVNFISMPGTTYDASPWYYLCDVTEARKIIKESFPCNDVFVAANVNTKEAYKTMKMTAVPSKPAKSDKEEDKPDFTTNNPSNSETSISGSDQDP